MDENHAQRHNPPFILLFEVFAMRGRRAVVGVGGWVDGWMDGRPDVRYCDARGRLTDAAPRRNQHDASSGDG